ncbi:MAG: glycosyltransferase family 2 protein [Ectothiorhodospiraceae bacterium]|nr:glycosyltransferase family 2 protein [Ectothiorhodospiraceae bacterium]
MADRRSPDGDTGRDGALAATESLDLSIVVALYNRLELTRAFLDSLARTCEPWCYEVILVDDGSTDGTREYLATLGAPYRVILNAERRGYAGSNNVGAAMARAPILALLNNDLVLTPRWLEPMLACLESAPDVGAVGNVHRNPRDGLVDHAGVAVHLDGSTFHSYKHRRGVPPGECREMPAVSAACLVMHRARFREMGGFDEGYMNGSEDIDLCARLRCAGYRLVVANRSVIWHHVSSSPGRLDHVDRNARRLQERFGAELRDWGRPIWAQEYLNRYARRPWRARPWLLVRAAGEVLVRAATGRGARPWRSDQ